MMQGTLPVDIGTSANMSIVASEEDMLKVLKSSSSRDAVCLLPQKKALFKKLVGARNKIIPSEF
jgi:hypothetical protein